ncbi:MAG: hypothetical protein ACI8SR_000805 [Oceanicoccus sp.]|jgi:hypothetical protein
MTTEYNKLISKTFCDNSIRSVMMIDDHFLPYRECVTAIIDKKDIDMDIISASSRAARLTDFFQNKKVICDIDNDADHLNLERIRKSDLLILDYHLDNENPEKSLKVLHTLKDSKHMNLVVIYTREDLTTTWLQIAASLKGTQDPENLITGDAQRKCWDDNDATTEIPQTWSEIFSKSENLFNYLKSGKPSSKAITELLNEPNFKKSASGISTAISESCLAEYNIIESMRTDDEITGRLDDKKWIKINNIFIVLCNKTEDTDDDSELIWRSLNESLHDWKPNYYRLISSEIQNEIEDGNIAMRGFLDGDYESQAAWLWRLKSDQGNYNGNLIEFLKGTSGHFIDRISRNEKLIGFSKECIDKSFIIKSEKPETELSLNSKEWQSYSYALVTESIEATFKKNATKREPIDVIHAINQSISSKEFTGTHITVGTVLKNESEDFYLCVSPSCDTIPNQLTDSIAKRMTPNRLLKFIKLEKVNLEKAIEHATQGKFIFIEQNGIKLALTSVNANTNQPPVDFGIVKNHDIQKLNENENIGITFLDTTFDSNNQNAIKFTAISQLKESYAARFQSIASDHAGRIGVDFISFSSSSKTPVSGNINLSGHINNPENMLVEGELKLESKQDLEGSLTIKSNLTFAADKRPINISGNISVTSNIKKRKSMKINSDLEVSSKN